MNLMPCLCSWELQQDVSYVHHSESAVVQMNRTMTVSYAMYSLPLVFGTSQKPGKQAVTSSSALEQAMMPLQF